MGQGSVALPDPLSATPVNPGNTDDLLAQLAGEEIERLLAEADEPTGAEPRAVKPPEVSPADTATPPSAPLQPLPQAPEPSSATPVAAPEEDLELNALFTQIDGTPPPPPVSTPPATVEAPSAADALVEEMLEDAATGGHSSLASNTVVSLPLEQPQAVGHLPIYFRVLEWVNRPLTHCSDQTRDLVGKIAILTTVNAAAILAYVIIFRAH